MSDPVLTVDGATAALSGKAMSPFLAALGVEMLAMADGQAELGLNLDERHMNNWHVTHGGVTMTLLDVAMSLAGRSLDPGAQSSVTIDMNTSFLQPAGKPGARLVARGRAYHRTLTMTFCEGEVWDGERLVAKAMGTFKYLRRSDAAKKMVLTTPDAV